jgi:hypothetical protein
MGAGLFHAEGQTHMTKLIVDFHNFANVPKNTRGMSVGAMPYLSKVCVPYNPKVHSDDQIKEPKRRKACCTRGRTEKFNKTTVRNYDRAI